MQTNHQCCKALPIQGLFKRQVEICLEKKCNVIALLKVCRHSTWLPAVSHIGTLMLKLCFFFFFPFTNEAKLANVCASLYIQGNKSCILLRNNTGC